jgi:hypothetical protein
MQRTESYIETGAFFLRVRPLFHQARASVLLSNWRDP